MANAWGNSWGGDTGAWGVSWGSATTTDTHDGWKREGFLEDWDERRYEAYRKRHEELRRDLERALGRTTGEQVEGLADDDLLDKAQELALDEDSSYTDISEIAASLRIYRQYLQDADDMTIILLLNQ